MSCINDYGEISSNLIDNEFDGINGNIYKIEERLNKIEQEMEEIKNNRQKGLNPALKFILSFFLRSEFKNNERVVTELLSEITPYTKETIKRHVDSLKEDTNQYVKVLDVTLKLQDWIVQYKDDIPLREVRNYIKELNQ